jgi:hypothetical protein
MVDNIVLREYASPPVPIIRRRKSAEMVDSSVSSEDTLLSAPVKRRCLSAGIVDTVGIGLCEADIAMSS